MKKVIYSKYANDRSDEYKIRTDIVEDESGVRYARKTPLTEKAKNHINAMYENYLGLTDEFSDTIIHMNRCERDGDVLEFEYVEGQTYEEYLDEILESKDTEAFIDGIKKFADIIKGAAKNDFVMTDEFRRMFGETPDFTGSKCLTVSDIDMIFPNIIIRDGIWEVIDYEWSYKIPIPVDFIIYRSFHYYDMGQRHTTLKELCNLFRMFGMDKETCRIFAEMETHFQNFLATGNTPLWKLYQSMQGKLYFPIGMIGEEQSEIYQKQIHIVKNYGNGEKNMDYYLSPVPDANGHLIFEVPVDSEMQVLVVYPAMRNCVVTVHAVETVGAEVKMLSYLHNGFSEDNKTIYYTNDAPYLMFPAFQENISAVRFELSVSFPHKAALIKSADTVDELHKLHQTLQEKQGEIGRCHMEFEDLRQNQENRLRMEYEELRQNQERQLRAEYEGRIAALSEENKKIKAELEEQQQVNQTLIHSISWKITKPIRGVKKVFHKVWR